MNDLHHTKAALALARRGLGSVWPNPSVGCVLVKEGRVVGRGWTQRGGRPHGETEALERAGALAKGATAYVSLEPCCHWGKTPPCTDALISAGIARAVIPIEDPDPRVSGRGVAKLREAGVAVDMGLCAKEAAELNAGFFLRLRSGRPLVTLKLAATLDGRLATADGESQWITGEIARDRGHLLRASHDVVMIGSNTVLADDPRLTCRLPGLDEESPVRVVVDGRLRVPLTARVVAEAGRVPTWFITLRHGDHARRAAFLRAGVELIEVPATGDHAVDMAAALSELGARGVTRVLVEGGATLAAVLLRARLVDRLAWFHAPLLLGGDAVPAVAPLGIHKLADAPRFERIALEAVGDDVLETLRRRD